MAGVAKSISDSSTTRVIIYFELRDVGRGGSGETAACRYCQHGLRRREILMNIPAFRRLISKWFDGARGRVHRTQYAMAQSCC